MNTILKQLVVVGLSLFLCGFDQNLTFASDFNTLFSKKEKADLTLGWINDCIGLNDCDIKLFHELSKYSRPSGKEHPLSQWIVRLYDIAKKDIWKSRPTLIQTDKMGNIVISLPSTGKFKGKNFSPVALQAHMDMVLAHAEATPGTNAESFFVNGVEMEEVGGWIQSKGRKSTLGSDNGIGVAYALRYLIDTSLSHPPLELIFTTQEEIGLKGAFGLEIELKSKNLLCLDGMTQKKGQLIVGSQGAFGARLFKKSIAADNQIDRNNFGLVRVELAKLLGGHSGNDIFRLRLNAVKGFSKFYDLLQKKYPEVRIAGLIAGDPSALNKIPNIFSVDLILPNQLMQSQNFSIQFEQNVSEIIRIVVQDFDEDAKNEYTVKFYFHADENKNFTVASPELISAVLKGIAETPNGVLEKNLEFPSSVQSSSNLSFVTLLPSSQNPESELDWASGFFSRSYLNESLSRIKNASISALKDSIESLFKSEVEIKIQSTYGAWLSKKETALQKHFIQNGTYFTSTTKANVGLEPSAFIAKYPKMDVVAISPMIEGAHTINERIEIESIQLVSLEIENALKNWKLK